LHSGVPHDGATRKKLFSPCRLSFARIIYFTVCRFPMCPVSGSIALRTGPAVTQQPSRIGSQHESAVPLAMEAVLHWGGLHLGCGRAACASYCTSQLRRLRDLRFGIRPAHRPTFGQAITRGARECVECQRPVGPPAMRALPEGTRRARTRSHPLHRSELLRSAACAAAGFRACPNASRKRLGLHGAFADQC
jgi:hypothetical protein